MKDFEKYLLTLIAWVGCFVLAIHAMNNDITIGVILAFLGAFAFPMLLWWSEDEVGEFARDEGATTHKPKREDTYHQKMQLLMELMDEDERAAFKQLLKEQIINNHHLADGLVDGELPFDADEYDLYDQK